MMGNNVTAHLPRTSPVAGAVDVLDHSLSECYLEKKLSYLILRVVLHPEQYQHTPPDSADDFRDATPTI